MHRGTENRRIIVVAILVIGISLFHYMTGQWQSYYHSFYSELYFLPLIIAGLWFGLRGALAASLGASALYLPFLFMRYGFLTPISFDRFLGLLVLNIVGAVMGILSDRKKARDKELRESERLTALGQTVSAVAHEIRTPLIAIAGYTRQVRNRLVTDGASREKLEIVLAESCRLETLLKEMLDFSRPPTLEMLPDDPQTLLDKCIAIMDNAGSNGKVKIEARVAPNLPQIRLDAEKMQQVLINLIMNAVHVSPEGQKVEVSVLGEGKKVCFDVTDHGPGIPPEIRDKLFLPFFTTKKNGTGLGLSIAQRIVQAHGGSISLLDNPDGGVTFRVSLSKFH